MGASVGPAIASALTDSLGDDGVAIQGVDYEATIASNANMGREGGPVMAKLVSQTKSNCPDSKIALGGYSQGGFVVSNAISSAGVNPDDIAAAVVYGDPSRQAAGGLDASKVKDYCVSGDGVCSGTFAITAAHLAYTRFVSPDVPTRRSFADSWQLATATPRMVPSSSSPRPRAAAAPPAAAHPPAAARPTPPLPVPRPPRLPLLRPAARLVWEASAALVAALAAAVSAASVAALGAAAAGSAASPTVAALADLVAAG